MSLTLRPGVPADAEACGRICFAAFDAINRTHGFLPDFPNPEVAIFRLATLLGDPGFYVVVAERDGRIVGSNVLDERSSIAGIGPVTVLPEMQNAGTGRALMSDVLARAAILRFAGVRLVQAAFHNRSLSLYAKLGFDIREPLSCMQGPAVGIGFRGYTVRPAMPTDREACNQLCIAVHGHNRDAEIREAIDHGMAKVVEHDGRITGYTTGMAFFSHSVGESNEDIKALIGAADAFIGPGIIVPSRNTVLMRWCLGRGLRITQPLTLMTRGLYNEPRGAFLPSIVF